MKGMLSRLMRSLAESAGGRPGMPGISAVARELPEDVYGAALTPRERQVYELLRGDPRLTNGQMIERMYGGIDEPSDSVIDAYLKNVMAKLDRASRAQR